MKLKIQTNRLVNIAAPILAGLLAGRYWTKEEIGDGMLEKRSNWPINTALDLADTLMRDAEVTAKWHADVEKECAIRRRVEQEMKRRRQ